MRLGSKVDSIMSYNMIYEDICNAHVNINAGRWGNTPKEAEYMNYIFNHKINVLNAFLYLKDKGDFKPYQHSLRLRVINHDMSKYGDKEFEIYRKKFHPESSDDKVTDEEFEEAFNNHTMNNSHHFQMFNNSEPMSKLDILEFVLDLSAMAINFKNCPRERYLEVERLKMLDYNIDIDYVDSQMLYADKINEKVKPSNIILIEPSSVKPLTESKLTAEDKKKIIDREWGLPAQKKFPLVDKNHIRSATSYFRTCSDELKPILAANIYRRHLELDISINRSLDWYKCIPKQLIDKKPDDKAFDEYIEI